MYTRKRFATPAPSTGIRARTVEMGAGAFKDRCLELLDQVGDGAVEVIVTKHGRPVAKVVAPDTEMPNAFGFMRGTVLGHDDIVSPDFDAWGEPD